MMSTVTKLLIVATALSGCFSLANAQSAGAVDETSGAPGGVLVTRDGESYGILSGDPVFAGDVVSTTSAATATISAFGCTIELAASSSVTVYDGFCLPGAVATVGNDATVEASQTGTAAVLGGVGLAALVGLAAGGGGGGGGGGSPVSP